ncbi:DUF4432 family protein [Cohnella silvisoli]|uniref:DUF4432 family protein n=1 Tax=Cohnella silvisoli TaxID=2873699 RepID=A0ABV1KVK4_9BACL|nr:DUF4432 family protein [Cohnella silvisoli]MCD9023531.1 aldose 1-epimerase family protein [Cohnella silvisoli]
MSYRQQRNYGCRIHDHVTYHQMKTIVLENELVRIGILLDKGTEIFEFLYKPNDTDIMWLSANGVQNPNEYLPTSPDGTSVFLDYYSGGWQEVFPNGGPPSTSLGASFGQHGEVTNMPWEYTIVEDTQDKVTVEFTVRTKKTPFILRKRLSLTSGRCALTIEETVENLSAVEIPVMWGQHIVFGHPFLNKNSYIEIAEAVDVIPHDTPICSIGRRVQGNRTHRWPLAKSETGESVDLSVLPERGTPSEMLYLHNFMAGLYKVVSPDKGISVAVQWDVSVFPYLWYWQEFGATTSYPWYGRHYNIGLEPFSSMPTTGLADAVKNNTALKLGPNETRSHRMMVEINPIH